MARGRARRPRKNDGGMLVIRPNVAGIDIGAKEHWVCGPTGADGERLVRVFRTTTGELEELAAWLIEQGVESVAMESTHVYWIPVYELLESQGLEVVLVNARQLTNVPGRKTDVADCQWLQLLHSCGLLRGSFRPSESICELRALQRQLANLVAEQSKCVAWMQKALDQMNVQVHRAVTDITGKTGMAIVRAIADGERNPTQLAAFRDARCRKSVDEIAEHLRGTWRREHLFNLQEALALYDALSLSIARYDAQILAVLDGLASPDCADANVPAHPNPAKEKAIKNRGDQVLRNHLWRLAGVDLTRIDGISSQAAKVIISEVGVDLTRFPTEGHFASWLRLTPRTSVSGGKQLHKKRRNGSGATRISGVLRMAALALQRSKTAIGAEFRRIARRKSGAVAIFAIARKLATLVFRMLRHGADYVDIGEALYEARYRSRRLVSITASAQELGFSLVPIEVEV